MKYLGVPLISSRLKAVYCKGLVVRITSKVRHWTCRTLSYAGRVQLINSVLFSIQVYWASVFLLPGQVIKNVEQILRSFLWSGSIWELLELKWLAIRYVFQKRRGARNKKDNRMEQDCFVETHLEPVQWLRWLNLVYLDQIQSVAR